MKRQLFFLLTIHVSMCTIAMDAPEQKRPVSFEDLPKDIKRYLLPLLTAGKTDEEKLLSVAQNITSLSRTNKEFHDLISNQTMMRQLLELLAASYTKNNLFDVTAALGTPLAWNSYKAIIGKAPSLEEFFSKAIKAIDTKKLYVLTFILNLVGPEIVNKVYPKVSDELLLVHAVNQRNAAAVEQLLKVKGLDVNALDIGTRRHVLLLALLGRDEKSIDALLSAPEININYQDSNNTTPLFAAIEYAPKMVKKIITDKRFDRASLNLPAKDWQGYAITPLHHAIDQANPELVELLINQPDIQINSKDSLGNTPLAIAQLALESETTLKEDKPKYKAIIKMLEQKGATE